MKQSKNRRKEKETVTSFIHVYLFDFYVYKRS